MIIGIAGPYSAKTKQQRHENLLKLNQAAALLLQKGHIPVIGANAALPVIEWVEDSEKYESIMRISLALIDSCEALLFLGESPGANRERDLIISKGLPVFYSIDEIPNQ